MWRLSLAMVVALAAGFGGGWRVCAWRDAAALVAGVKPAVTSIEHAAAVSQAVAVRAQSAQDRIRTVTRTLIEEVSSHVPPAVDAAYALPRGFVRLHDAAAAGVDLPAAAASPGQPDDAPSGVALSDAAAVIVGNYGACRADQARLATLQQWARAQGLAD